MSCIGTFPCIIEYYDKSVEEIIYVCKEVEDFLLAWYVCKAINILPSSYPKPIEAPVVYKKSTSGVTKTENKNFLISPNPTPSEIQELERDLLYAYSDVFSEQNTLREMISKPMKISLTEDAVPYALSVPRQIPLSYRNLVKDELQSLVAAGIIAPVKEATNWVHPMVVVPKPSGGIRLCIDLQKLNKYVRRPYHPSKPPSEAISNISPHSKFFSTLDAKKVTGKYP